MAESLPADGARIIKANDGVKCKGNACGDIDYRWEEKTKSFGARATAHLAAVGREPQPVEPKLLLPLVQAASLETNEALAEKWAALLANAADPAQRVGRILVIYKCYSSSLQMMRLY